MSKAKIDMNKVVRVLDVVCFTCGNLASYDPPKKQRLKNVVCPKCGGFEVFIISPDLGLPPGVDVAVTARDTSSLN